MLSFLYVADREDNPYRRNQNLLDWIGLVLRYWSALQHKDGSFDEAYPFERSLAATAFTAFYVAEALELMGDALPQEIQTVARETLVRAGDWLVRNEESHGFLTNHVAAASAALHHIYRISGSAPHRERSRHFLAEIFRRQSPEGWYEEYGGADPGYQTHGVFYLVRLHELMPDEALADSIKRAMTFLAHFVHPDGSLGGEYASRNTKTYYPAAFERFAARDAAAGWIAESMRSSIATGASAALRSVDAYNYFPFLNNFVFAELAAARSAGFPPPEEPASGNGVVWFREAGIARIRRSRYDAYIGTAKGGVLKVFDRRGRRLVYADCGYIGRLKNGKIVSSQYLDTSREVQMEADRVIVHGAFSEVTRPTMRPLRFALFRIFSISVGRHPRIAQWLKRLLVRVLIHRRKQLRIRLRRMIQWDDREIHLADFIEGPDGGRLALLRQETTFTSIHMGSSRYFVLNELEASNPTGGHLDPSVDPGKIPSGLERKRSIGLDV